MKVLEPIHHCIDKGIDALNLPLNPENLYEPLRYFMTLGGKRMRPVFTLLSAEMYGIAHKDALPGALAIELFHNFTLIHDDMMDHAPLRRGKVTVHERWNNDIALLSGDVLMIKAYEQLSHQKIGPLDKMLSLLNKTAIEVCEGQQLDMDFEQRLDVQLDEYRAMIRLKTSVLLGCAVEMGAIIGGANEGDRTSLYAFGEHVGMAFQIQDDLLDLYAEAHLFGKQVGGDVIANKKTLLNLLAYQHADQAQKARLDSLSNEKDLAKKVSEVKEIYDQIGAKKLCEIEMQEHHEKAIQALKGVSLSEEKKKTLYALSDYLLTREN
jgi:geranylgeranyl diphosphate synthase type II